MIPQLSVSYTDLLHHPHFLLEQAPDLAVVSERLVRLDGLVVVAKFDHDVTFRFKQAVEDKLVFEQRILVMCMLTHKDFKHLLDGV